MAQSGPNSSEIFSGGMPSPPRRLGPFRLNHGARFGVAEKHHISSTVPGRARPVSTPASVRRALVRWTTPMRRTRRSLPG